MALGSADAANQGREVLLRTTNDSTRSWRIASTRQQSPGSKRFSSPGAAGRPNESSPSHTHHSLLVGHFLATSASLLDQETVRGTAPARHQHRSTSATALHRYRAALVLVPASSIFPTSQQSSSDSYSLAHTTVLPIFSLLHHLRTTQQFLSPFSPQSCDWPNSLELKCAANLTGTRRRVLYCNGTVPPFPGFMTATSLASLNLTLLSGEL